MKRSHSAHAAAGGVLTGLKVVDLSRVLGGPICTQILGDHGADIIKVEPPQGDETRTWGPPFKDGVSGYFAGANRNKRAIALNLKLPEAQQVLFRLLEDADILVENFKPGSMEVWGLDYETVIKPKFPKLIYCRITGFGTEGPLGGFPGYDAIVQGWSGLMSVTGSMESGPTRIGVPLIDLSTGYNATIGLLLAYIERQRTGRGRLIEIALYDVALAMLQPHASNWLMDGREVVATGNKHPTIAPYGIYEAGTGRIIIASGNDAQFARLCEVLERPDLAVMASFSTNKARVLNREALDVELNAALKRHDAEDLAAKLMKRGVPAGVVSTVAQALSRSHTVERGMIERKEGYAGIANPIKMSQEGGTIRYVPPAFSADTLDILRELQYGTEAIDALIRSGAVVTRLQTGKEET